MAVIYVEFRNFYSSVLIGSRWHNRGDAAHVACKGLVSSLVCSTYFLGVHIWVTEHIQRLSKAFVGNEQYPETKSFVSCFEFLVRKQCTIFCLHRWQMSIAGAVVQKTLGTYKIAGSILFNSFKERTNQQRYFCLLYFIFYFVRYQHVHGPAILHI